MKAQFKPCTGVVQLKAEVSRLVFNDQLPCTCISKDYTHAHIAHSYIFFLFLNFFFIHVIFLGVVCFPMDHHHYLLMQCSNILTLLTECYLDRVELVDARPEVVGVTAEGDLQRLQKLVHAIQQWPGPATHNCEIRMLGLQCIIMRSGHWFTSPNKAVIVLKTISCTNTQQVSCSGKLSQQCASAKFCNHQLARAYSQAS